MTSPPKYDPEDLARYEMTEDEAEEIREGLASIDRGETASMDEVWADAMAAIDAVSKRRRTG
jgi:hypothetical protein